MSVQLYDQFNRPLPTGKPKPERGALYVPTIRDRWSTYPGRGITPGKLSSILREADQGYPARQVELFRDAEEKDAHLTAEMGKRRAAVMGLNYEIYTDSDDAKAERITEFCREVIFGLEDFDDLISDLVDAVAQGWAMCEIKWDVSSGQAVIADHVCIPQERTVWDDNNIPRLATDSSPAKGEEIPPFKVIFHRRKGSLFAAKAGIMRTCIWWWLFKNFSVKDWMSFADVFGVPLRVGKYDTGASPEDREALKRALVSLGSDGAALVSKATEIEFIESKISGGSQLIFERLANFCDRANSKAILGQTLTTDVGNSGSRALGEVHNQVRTDLRDADAYAIAKTLRQQLLRPLVLFNYGPDAPVPWFKFAIEPEKDLKEKGETYDRVMGWGVPISMAHIYETFDIPAPEPGDEVVVKSGGQAELNKRVHVELNSAQVSPGQEAIDALADSAIEWAEGAADGMAETLHSSLRAADSFEGLLGLTLHDFTSLDAAGLAQPLERALIAAEINGHLAAAGNRPAREYANRRRGPRPMLNNRGQLIFEPLDPEEAFRFWAGQAPVTRDVFDRLSDDAKLRAFTVAGVFREDMLGELYSAIDTALRDGTTLAEFQAVAADIFERRGLAGPKPWHLATVFNTNLQSAYMAGRYKQMAGLAAERPYWQYSAVMDAVTRPDHAAQHGKVYQVGHPYWSKWFPPNGHGCRCDVLSLSEDELRARGLRVERSMSAGEPDPGWDHSVGEAGWGRGLVEAAFGGKLAPGAWTYREDLTIGGDAAPGLPAGGPAPGLPDYPEELLSQLGSEDAVRAHYRQAAIEALGLAADAQGLLKDLPLSGPMGEGVVLAGRMVDYATGKAQDLARGRYVGLAKDAVQAADEIWLVPGQRTDGRISLRRRYFKFYNDGGRTVLVANEAERGVWQGFNAMPLNERTTGQQRKGLLLYQREQPL